MDAVSAFYEQRPYPPAADDLDSYRLRWTGARREAESYLFWPFEPHRDDRSTLVAGCGTSQAAHYAVCWPNASIAGIDVSESSIAFEEHLKQRHALENLELHVLSIERAHELGRKFDHIVCTGVLHHLADPGAALQTLRMLLKPHGAMHLMVYAPYGRAGVYVIQEYCRQLGIGTTDSDIRDLAVSLRSLPPDHPLVPLLRNSPDFSTPAGIADALLHPRDRAYSVPQLFELLAEADLAFGRWVRQAPYLPSCGSLAAPPHRSKLQRLEPAEQYAAVELFRGTMVRHSVVAYHRTLPPDLFTPDFESQAWAQYVPMRLADTIAVRENLPPGAAAVLINRSHTYTDLYLPVDERELRMLDAVDGKRAILEIAGSGREPALAQSFFEKLWQWDQVALAMSGTR